MEPQLIKVVVSLCLKKIKVALHRSEAVDGPKNRKLLKKSLMSHFEAIQPTEEQVISLFRRCTPKAELESAPSTSTKLTADVNMKIIASLKSGKLPAKLKTVPVKVQLLEPIEKRFQTEVPEIKEKDNFISNSVIGGAPNNNNNGVREDQVGDLPETDPTKKMPNIASAPKINMDELPEGLKQILDAFQKNLNEENKRLREQMAQMEKTFNEENKKLREQNEALKARMTNLEAKVTRLEKNNESLVTQCKNLEAKVTRLDNEKKEQEKASQIKYNNLLEEKNILSKQLERTQKLKEDAEARYNEEQNKLTSLKETSQTNKSDAEYFKNSFNTSGALKIMTRAILEACRVKVLAELHFNVNNPTVNTYVLARNNREDFEQAFQRLTGFELAPDEFDLLTSSYVQGNQAAHLLPNDEKLASNALYGFEERSLSGDPKVTTAKKLFTLAYPGSIYKPHLNPSN